jgi:hypothetical protein
LPTILSSAAAGLPFDRFATGSAMVNMSRQIGSVLGISLLVAIMGTPSGYSDVHRAYIRTWLVIVAFMILAGLTSFGMSPRPSDTPASYPSGVVAKGIDSRTKSER